MKIAFAQKANVIAAKMAYVSKDAIVIVTNVVTKTVVPSLTNLHN